MPTLPTSNEVCLDQMSLLTICVPIVFLMSATAVVFEPERRVQKRLLAIKSMRGQRFRRGAKHVLRLQASLNEVVGEDHAHRAQQ
jgi:hypothetical protein